ncbi:polysaccharide deacetylase family protein [Fervidibacillus albus]|uniref:Polysaccharide deacetylase family protein n=1 Tax=Fervidibacillus albus TaxID=2980026 RepID=A0A9E8RX44_9BACI|nr:polysaccharide deacetylase family protein [Fervidibacillus albus]WAA11356.1 polysaccharide deacetylase family protein [Fervidibacillus albus]
MHYFLVVNGRKLKNFTTIVLTAIVTAWFVYIQNVSLTTFSTDDGPRAFFKGKEGIALTFNISWGDEIAEKIIDILKKNEIQNATFFLSGSWAENHPHIVEKISNANFEIGLLGYNYLDYEEVKDEEIRRDLLKAEEIFQKLGVSYKKIVRAPNGHYDERFLKIADQLNLTVVHWSINTNDWKNPGVEAIMETVQSAKNGDIILMHASDSGMQTAVALPKMIESFQSKGITFVTVSDMVAEGKVTTEEVH